MAAGAAMTRRKRLRHLLNGNCWKVAYQCGGCSVDSPCDVCHQHDSPRGDCKGCSPCPACPPTAENVGRDLVDAVPEPPPTVMLAAYWSWSGGPDRFVRFGQVMADTGFDAQPTDEEMQHVMHAAKMEWGRCLRRRKARR